MVGYRRRYVVTWVRHDAYCAVTERTRDGDRLVDWVRAPGPEEWDQLGVMDRLARAWLTAQGLRP